MVSVSYVSRQNVFVRHALKSLFCSYFELKISEFNMSSSDDSSDHLDHNEDVQGKYVKVATKTKNSDDESCESASDTERTTIRKELSEMSFEELMKLKEELGSKVYNEAIFGSETRREKRPKQDYKRDNKNRPREMTSKRKVPLLSIEPERKERKIRDPRFDEKCGTYDSHTFKDNYEFISEIREKEIADLKSRLKKTEDDDERENIKFCIRRLKNQNLEEQKRKIKKKHIEEEQKEIQKAKDEGRQPHYKTKRERKATELVKQYLELKKSGKLNRYLERRRKKNAAKDRKRIKIS